MIIIECYDYFFLTCIREKVGGFQRRATIKVSLSFYNLESYLVILATDHDALAKSKSYDTAIKEFTSVHLGCKG